MPEREYVVPCCPHCQEECHVCTHEKIYVDENGEYVQEEEEESEEVEEEEEEEDEPYPTTKEIKKMKKPVLLKLIEEYALEVDPEGLSLKELQAAVVEASVEDEEAEDDDEEDED